MFGFMDPAMRHLFAFLETMEPHNVVAAALVGGLLALVALFAGLLWHSTSRSRRLRSQPVEVSDAMVHGYAKALQLPHDEVRRMLNEVLPRTTRARPPSNRNSLAPSPSFRHPHALGRPPDSHRSQWRPRARRC